MITFVIIFLFGIILGSFTNALAWRILNNRNFVSERSECTSCGHQLASKDLIPVASWVFLRGKCRYCSKKISIQYPIIELLTGALFVLIYSSILPSSILSIIYLATFFLATVILVTLTITDLKEFVLPSKLTMPLALIGLLMVFLRFLIEGDTWVLVDALIGVVLTAGLFQALFVVSDEKWIGGGDVKLALFLGSFGWVAGLMTIFLGSLLGSLIAIVLLATKKLDRKSFLPFGPLLIAGFYSYIFFGEMLVDGYLGLLGY